MLIQRRKTICLFCGQDLQPKSVSTKAMPTDEDVVPRWLQRCLEITDQIVTPMHISTADLSLLHARGPHTVSALKAGSVCAACNNGWMNDLENLAKPILISLIEGKRFFGDLQQRERYTLARWTLKTAAAFNRSSSYGIRDDNFGRPVPDNHLRVLAAGSLPSEVMIVGSLYPASTNRFDFLQMARWANLKNSIPLEEAHRNQATK